MTIRAAVSAAIPRIKNVASELSLCPTFLKTLKLKKKLPFAHAGDSAVLILTRLLNKKVEIPYKTRSFNERLSNASGSVQMKQDSTSLFDIAEEDVLFRIDSHQVFLKILS